MPLSGMMAMCHLFGTIQLGPGGLGLSDGLMVYGQMPPVNCPPACFCHPGQKPLDKTPPPVKRPSGQTTLPVSDRESMYSVYYVIIVTGIGAMLLKNNERHNASKTANLWYGNELYCTS